MRFLMNTGRTIGQGMHVEDKFSADYANETSVCFMHPLDMFEMGVDEGDHVSVTGDAGCVVLEVVMSGDLGEGSVFIPYGPYANFIIHSRTHSTGMPDFKSCMVEIEPSAEDKKTIGELMAALGGREYEGR